MNTKKYKATFILDTRGYRACRNAHREDKVRSRILRLQDRVCGKSRTEEFCPHDRPQLSRGNLCGRKL